MRKMSCLVDALESIVAEDKGRASELIQVRKTQAQTELQRDQAMAMSRQSDLKLRYLVGDLPMLDEGLTIPLARVPDVNDTMRQIEFGLEARQLKLQADASETYVEAIKASQLPQVALALTGTKGRYGNTSNAGSTDNTSSSSWQAGVTVSYNLFNGFTDDAVKLSALRRAQATREQLRELLNSKQSRTAEVHDAATSAFERAKRYVDVLRDSELVRNATFQQWAVIGKRSLFDVMSAESDHFNLRIAYVNALYDGYQASAQLRSMGAGLSTWLAADVR
jgi:outer membrane protein, adhesin transport system